jgi:hypothetical protein
MKQNTIPKMKFVMMKDQRRPRTLAAERLPININAIL